MPVSQKELANTYIRLGFSCLLVGVFLTATGSFANWKVRKYLVILYSLSCNWGKCSDIQT